MKFLNIFIDDRPIKVNSGYTIMQTAAILGTEIPRFCYHDKLLIAGNCRICLVEVLGSKKLVASCAVHVANGISIYTNTTRVRLARQNVLEFLLANHPLDCPICDQGGECDLQDITAVFGADRGRFYEHEKRAVMNKDFGPLIRTSMNRCIHCTRCVRFITQVSGSSVLGTLGRGSSTEIGSYVSQFLYDTLSGNITDLCPVGALTSKPYSFKVRPWELTSVNSIDVLDSLNSNITIDVAVNKIFRILPYANEYLNEEWITNKARYSYDGLFLQRLNSCLLKIDFFSIFNKQEFNLCKNKVNLFIKISLNSSAYFFVEKLTSKMLTSFTTYLGNLIDLETTVSAKFFAGNLGSSCVNHMSLFPNAVTSDFSHMFMFNTSVTSLTKLPSFCLLLGLNTRFEAPILNLKLNKLYNDYQVSFYSIGAGLNYLAFNISNLSTNLATFFDICEFKNQFCKNFYLSTFSSHPLILIGSSILARFDSNVYINATLSLCYRIFYLWGSLNKFNSIVRLVSTSDLFIFKFFGVVHLYSSTVGALDITFSPGILDFSSKIKHSNLDLRCTSLVYALGCDSNTLSQIYSNTNRPFLIYQGFHGSGLSFFADLILPVSSYVERQTLYKNLTGFLQKSNLILSFSEIRSTDNYIFEKILLLFFNKFFNKFRDVYYNYSVHYSFLLKKNYAFLTNTVYVNTLTNSFYSNFSLLDLRFHFFLAKNFKKTFFYSSDRVLFLFTFLFLNAMNFIELGNLSKFGLVTRQPINQLIPNYYGDTTNSVVLSSKVMNICSNVFLKKNFSFSTQYN